MNPRLPRPWPADAANPPQGSRRTPARAQAPLLDRLIDLEPETVTDPPITAAAAMDSLRQSVRNDLEALLNSRRRWRSWDPNLRELDRSLVGYGLPDFASGAFNDASRREELRAEIEAILRRFEPRIVSLSVTLLNPDDQVSQSFKVRIEAMLQAEPAPEPINFETVVDPASASLTVRTDEA